MSNFVTLLVEDDAFQREVLADVLKDEGFEVIECTTAEAAELIIASTGTELQALVTDQQPSGCNVRGRARSICPPPTPAYEHHHYVRQDGEPIPVNATFLQKPFTAEQLLEAVRD